MRENKASLLGLLACVALNGAPAHALPDPLSTVSERSGFVKTGRYDEVRTLCEAFAKKWPKAVRWEAFGTTPEGRPMLALVVSRSGALSPAETRSKSVPVMLMQGGIHAGEIDGKDAGFWALRDMLEKDDPALEKVTIVFVPVFNVDGHERFAANNRPNQVGPEEMGWRVTSQNLNLNRDYGKADSPEMTAMLELLNRWDPILYVDLHVTDGAQFQPDVALLVEPVFIGDPKLAPLAKAMRRTTMEKLRSQGSTPLDFYPSFRTYSDPASGFNDSAYTPRFSTGYWPLSNRMAMLVETHSWKDYKTRVRVTYNTIRSLAETTARDGATWLAAAKLADKDARSLGGTEVALSFKNTEHHRTIDFPGYAYTRTPSKISGGTALVYDPTKPQIWQIPYYDEVVPNIVVEAPRGGYLIPASDAVWMAQRLKAHGIAVEKLTKGLTATPVEVFRAETVNLGAKSVEGHQNATLTGHWTIESQAMTPGSLFVPIAQPKARLVMALLEPQAPDSYASWGFFNAYFEQKEYMEEYVAEEVAKDMLLSRPEVKAEFESRLASDPEFAKSPEARLDFFYRQHPSYDSRLNLYPVMRVDAQPRTD